MERKAAKTESRSHGTKYPVSAITRSTCPQNQNQVLKRSPQFLPAKHLTQKLN